MNVLMTHSWPGNIRELQNLSEVLVVLWNENRKIDVNDLPKSCFQKAPTADYLDYLDYNDAMRSFEKEFIRNILSETGWNKTEAAKKMGIHRNTLLLKMKEFELNSRP